jgi:hypothetical protein
MAGQAQIDEDQERSPAMEEILGLFGFSLGATLGIGAVRSLTDSSQPMMREAFKAGIRAWDALASVTGAARQAASPDDQSAAPTRRGGRRRVQPEKIVIAHQ